MEQKAHAGIGGRSYIAAGSVIVGDLEFPGLIEVFGTITGNLSAASIVLGEGGVVQGSLLAASITLRGQATGKIIAETVTCHATARIAGEITYATLIVESGAELNATARLRPQQP